MTATAVDLSNSPFSSELIPIHSRSTLTKLVLVNSHLSDTAFLAPFSSTLTFLNLSINPNIPPSSWVIISSLSNLFVLNLSHCAISSFPPAISTLASLKALVLSNNTLESLPDLSRLTSLNTLVVSHNKLLSLPPSLSNLSSLVKLSASHNNLSSSALAAIDLSSLSTLRQLRLNDNPNLDALPPHFASWGKATQGAIVGKGLELLELGNCSFKDWSSLRFIAAHSSINNFSLKGTPIEEEAIKDVGPMEFRQKLLILLPSLRILDSSRFDAKHQDLKKRRESRDAVQKIIDAGPMARVINERSENPIAVPPPLLAIDKKRKRTRIERPTTPTEEQKEGVVEVEDPSQTVIGVLERIEDKEEGRESEPKKKKKKESKAMAEENSAEEVKQPKPKKKNRHDPTPKPSTPAPIPPTPTLSTSTSTSTPTADLPKPPKKRGRESKFLGTTRTPEERTLAAEVQPKKAKKQKRETREESVGGLLDELRGDENDRPLISAPVPSREEIKEKERETVKEKTSVVKVVVVEKRKRKDQEEEDGQSVLNLLTGLGSTAEMDGGVALKGWD